MGFLYPVFAGELNDFVSVLNGILIGLIGGVFIAFIERPSLQPRKSKFHFIRRVVIKSIYYTFFFGILVLLVIAFTRGIETGTGFFGYLKSERFRHFVFEEDYHIILAYILLLSAILVFTKQLKRKIGPPIFLHTLTGKYYQPKEEERVFMFLDLVASTTIAERLGEVKFHEFINQFFYDITPSIEVTGGEIYRYVGDEIVISWPVEKGTRNANCIRTYYHARSTISKRREFYLQEYGFVPTFRAGMHLGRIMCGEVGDVKTQLVFLGEALYICSQILKSCKQLETPLLLTETLMSKIDLPNIYEVLPMGILDSEVNASSLEFFTLNEKAIRAY